MASLRAAENAAQLAVALVLISVPLWAGDYNASQIGLFLLYGMATQSVAFCWGRVGFLPLGQALFFGIGAYASALILKGTQFMSPSIVYLCLSLAILLPAFFAYVIAIVIFSRRIDSGPYFSLITLALCMLAFLLVNRWADVTGGFNGLTGVPDLPGTDRYGSLYYVIATLSVCVTAIFSWLARRPIGVLWSAVSQNEERLQFFGFATHKLKAVAFATAGGVAGLGGALYAPHEGMVSPQAIGIVLSTQFIIWAAVGGKSGPLGAQLGAVIVGLVASVLRDVFAYWEVFVAIGFIVIVRLFPDGLAGACKQLLKVIGIRHTPTSLACAELAPRVRRQTLEEKEKLLVFEDVRAEQGGVKILNGLNLDISERGVTCLIGPNGAGKTSSFNAMTGRLEVKAGRICFMGMVISKMAAWEVARLGVGRKFQIPTVFSSLSVGENLLIAQWANRIRPLGMVSRKPLRWTTSGLQRMLHRFPSLATSVADPACTLAQGNRQMLEFAMVAISEPRLMLLDEPCAGLSADETHQMMDAITCAVSELQASSVVIEHDMSALERIADHVVVLHQGRRLAAGSLSFIRSSDEVRQVYAGGRK